MLSNKFKQNIIISSFKKVFYLDQIAVVKTNFQIPFKASLEKFKDDVPLFLVK